MSEARQDVSDRQALSAEPRRIRIWIEADVIPAELIPAADEMLARRWSADGSIGNIARSTQIPAEVVAFFEAILGSTPGEHPSWLYDENGDGLDFGGEIVGPADS